MQDDPTTSKKSSGSASQYILYGGVLLAGGLTALTFALLYSKKNNDFKSLEQKFASNEIVYVRQMDSLANEFKMVSDKYIFLQADNETLDKNLTQEQSRNKSLAFANANLSSKEKQYKSTYSSLQASNAKTNAENESLKNEAALLRAQVQRLQGILDDRDETIAKLHELDNQRLNDIESGNTTLEALRDSINREHYSGYFVNPELTGGYGLFETNYDYAYWYGGLTVVNGYVINKHWRTGLGIGFHYYDAGPTVPVFLDFRYMLNKRLFTPYVFADGGFMVDLKELRVPNSVYMNPGFGVYRSLGDHLSLNLGAGLFVQSFDIRSSFVNIKVGITFKK